MSKRRRSEPLEADDGASEGWESLAEEEGPSLPENPELEAALREAAEAVDAYEQPRRDPPGEAPASQAGEPDASAQQLAQVQDRLVRLQADFENFRRRAERERLEVSQYGHQNLVKDLLATVDNLDRALDHARTSGGGDVESLLQGVELVQRELMAALTKHGVVRIEALGQPFDPAVHEAMAQAPDDSVAPNTVIDEMQRGYKLRDRLLRPSRVVVARPAEPQAPTQPDREDGDAA